MDGEELNFFKRTLFKNFWSVLLMKKSKSDLTLAGRIKIVAITICYIFALLHNASTLWRKVIAFGITLCLWKLLLLLVVVALSSWKMLSLFLDITQRS